MIRNVETVVVSLRSSESVYTERDKAEFVLLSEVAQMCEVRQK